MHFRTSKKERALTPRTEKFVPSPGSQERGGSKTVHDHFRPLSHSVRGEWMREACFRARGVRALFPSVKSA